MGQCRYAKEINSISNISLLMKPTNTALNGARMLSHLYHTGFTIPDSLITLFTIHTCMQISLWEAFFVFTLMFPTKFQLVSSENFEEICNRPL